MIFFKNKQIYKYTCVYTCVYCCDKTED